MTEQVQLNAKIPADAARIVNEVVGRLRMDGLSGADVNVLLVAIKTLVEHTSPNTETKVMP